VHDEVPAAPIDRDPEFQPHNQAADALRERLQVWPESYIISISIVDARRCAFDLRAGGTSREIC
jgi:hypothetical protein